MPYTRITGTRNGAEAIAYAEGTGKGHNGHELRNLYVGAVGMSPSGPSFAEQMQPYWNKASSKNKNQIRRIVISFSKKELDPENPASVGKAAVIADEFCRTAYPGHQACYFIQNDGEGGCLHVHILENNVSMETYKGCTREQTHFDYVKKHANAIIEKYTNLDFGSGQQRDKVTQTERHKQQAGEYVWKDDLRERIKAARDAAKDMDDFKRQLTLHGVEADFTGPKSEKTRAKRGRYVVYELTDISGFEGGKVPDNLRARSYKLGDDYGAEALEEYYASRGHNRPVQQAEKPKQDTPVPPTPKKQDPPKQTGISFDVWKQISGYVYDDDMGRFLDAFERYKKEKDTPLADLQAAYAPKTAEKPPTRPVEAGKGKDGQGDAEAPKRPSVAVQGAARGEMRRQADKAALERDRRSVAQGPVRRKRPLPDISHIQQQQDEEEREY